MDTHESAIPRFVSLSQELNARSPSGLVDRTFSAILGPLFEIVASWYHYSLPRLILLESRSLYHRISFLRCKRLVLNFAEVRRSLPQVSCSDSRNESQFCTASIQRLSAERPYLTLADYRLFVEGFFLAEKWYAHLDRLRHNEQQDSSVTSDESENSLCARSDRSPVRTAQQGAERDKRPHPASRPAVRS